MLARSTILGLVTSLLFVSSLLALGGDHPPGQKVAQQPEWPHGLAKLINSEGRVFGHWVNANDFFYYKGDVDSFNRFVGQYAQLGGTPLEVVLHVGKLPLTGPLGKDHTLFYDWKLDVMRRGWGVLVDPQRPKNDPGYVVTVHLWLGERFPLEQLDIPARVTVRSGGELEEFINQRKARK